MVNDKVKKILINLVDENPGVKATTLITKATAKYYEEKEEGDTPSDVLESLNFLVDQKQLVEIEYVLPTMSYRVKSLYFPKGTKVRVLS